MSVSAFSRSDFRYQAYYCEENAWWLAADPRLAAVPRWVVFVTNARRACPIWCQRARPDGGAVVWDYHVVVVAELDSAPMVFDLDTTLAFPTPLSSYLTHAFPSADQWPPVHRPMFRVVEADEVIHRFASDRRHMRTEAGGWQSPPPPWPPIQGSGAPHDLERWLALDGDAPGSVCDLSGLAQMFRWPGSHADRVGP